MQSSVIHGEIVRLGLPGRREPCSNNDRKSSTDYCLFNCHTGNLKQYTLWVLSAQG